MSSLKAYVRSRQLELACTLTGKKAIYLDINFWIILRDVLLGVRNSPVEKELLSLLREGIQRGIAFCPINDSTFVELLKKADSASRSVTAGLMDELSLGVTLIPYEMRAATELAHFLHSARTPNEVYALEQLMWSKLAYVLGFQHPVGSAFTPTDMLKIQKMFFDHMWTLSLREMVDQIGSKPLPHSDGYKMLAERLNQLNSLNTGELRSFSQTYEIEVHGVLDAFADVSYDIVTEMARKDFGEAHSPSAEQRAKSVRQIHNLLFVAFTHDATKAALRTLHIFATLHAAVRWNRQQRLKTNDFLDFQHAAAALGYCDAFFTERPLRSLITASHVALDKTYGCRVMASPEEATTYLRELLTRPAPR
jgi:hypothetical protein